MEAGKQRKVRVDVCSSGFFCETLSSVFDKGGATSSVVVAALCAARFARKSQHSPRMDNAIAKEIVFSGMDPIHKRLIAFFCSLTIVAVCVIVALLLRFLCVFVFGCVCY